MAPNTPAKTQISVTGETLSHAVVPTAVRVLDRLLPPLMIVVAAEARLEAISAFVFRCAVSAVPTFPLFSEGIVSWVQVKRVRFEVSLCVCRRRTNIFAGGECH